MWPTHLWNSSVTNLTYPLMLSACLNMILILVLCVPEVSDFSWPISVKDQNTMALVAPLWAELVVLHQCVDP